MRKSDKKANIAEANRLAEEAFMKEREMMGIPSPKKESTDEASSPAQQAAIAINMKEKGIEPKNEDISNDNQSFNVEAAVNEIIEKNIKGGIESLTSREAEILFEADTFSLLVTCDLRVEESPYYIEQTWDSPAEGSDGILDFDIDKGSFLIPGDDGEKEIEVPGEQLKKLETVLNDVINDSDTLYKYFDDNDDGPDYDEDWAKEQYRSRFDEEINEIKKITKRLLGE